MEALRHGYRAFTRDAAIYDDASSVDDFEMIDTDEAALDSGSLAEIQRWLQPTDYEAASSEFNRHLLARAPGTGLWLCGTEGYREWYSSDEHGSLWVKGVPGAGKSVIAASIANNLKQTEHALVLTFFFRYIVTANRTSRRLVRDWLAQLLPSSVRLQHSLQSARGRELDDFSDEQLWGFLLSGLSNAPKVYCIVDALDEMDLDSDNGFLSRINKLATFRPNKVKILMTSRPKQYLQRALPENSIVHISLERDLVGLDIAQYVKNRLEKTLPGSGNHEYRETAEVAIVERCDGLFLYARLLLDQVLPGLACNALPDAKELVASIPLGLESMYTAMLHRQAISLEIDQNLQQFILETATHCTRPLRLNELSQALECAFPHIQTPISKYLARSACSPLLEILEDETVQVIHHSLTEFLLNSDRQVMDIHSEKDSAIRGFPILEPPTVHKRLAILCLKYLQLSLDAPSDCIQEPDGSLVNDNFAIIRRGFMPSGIRTSEKGRQIFDYSRARLEHPFLEYSAAQWATHAAKYDVEDSEFFQRIVEFVHHENKPFHKWLRIEFPHSEHRTHASTLHIAAFAGLTHLAKNLDIKPMMNSIDGDARTPLHWASRRGSEAIAALLLDNGASPESRDYNGCQPMHEAARMNHHKTVTLLLKAGGNPTALKGCDSHGSSLCRCDAWAVVSDETPLLYACMPGHESTMLAMIPYLDEKALQEALCRSCLNGSMDSVRCLLENSSVSPNNAFNEGLPIVLATSVLDLTSVQLLIRYGADVNAISWWKPLKVYMCGRSPERETAETALHKLMRVWDPEKLSVCLEILKALIKAGADVNALDSEGRNPLDAYMTKDYGRPRFDRIAMRALLKAGATFKDEENDGVLCRALKITQDTRALQDLIERGACLHNRGKWGLPVLHEALECRNDWLFPLMPTKSKSSNPEHDRGAVTDLVQFLLDRGARLEDTDSMRRTALEVGAELWHKDLPTFRYLFEACLDPVARQNCIWRLEQPNVADDLQMEYLNLLLNSGVSLEARNAGGQTPLLAQVTSAQVRRILINTGARIDVVDSEGRGLPHTYISENGYYLQNGISDFCDLMALGFSPNVIDANGNSLLHLIAQKWGHDRELSEILQYLLDQGLDPTCLNKKGQSALHIYMASPPLAPSSGVVYTRGSREIEQHRGIFAGRRIEKFVSPLQSLGYDINVCDSHGQTALHLAAAIDPAIFAYLLRRGADVFARDESRKTMLHIASTAGQVNIVGQVLDITGEKLLNEADVDGRVALHEACKGGHIEVVDLLLCRGANPSIKDSRNQTPLHACAELDLDVRAHDIAGMLVEAGAPPEMRDSTGYTVLDRALDHKRKAIIRYLAGKFENIDHISGMRASRWTFDGGDNEEQLKATLRVKVAMLSRCEPSIVSLHEAHRTEIFRNANDFVEQLYEHDLTGVVSHLETHPEELKHFWEGGFLRCVAENGRVDLMGHMVSLARHLEDRSTAQEIMRRYRSERKTDYYEYDPMIAVACERDNSNMLMLRYLIKEHGFSPNIPRSVGWDDDQYPDSLQPGLSPMHILARARSWWQLDAARYLISMGAIIEARDHLGRTPLHIASDELASLNDKAAGLSIRNRKLWKLPFVKLLLDNGADPNATNTEGWSSLHMACGSPDVLRLLLQHGASLTCGNNSPLFSAIQQQSEETLRILLDAGCGTNVVDDRKDVDTVHDFERQDRYPLLCVCFSSTRIENSVPLILPLLEHGADVYASLDAGETLLHYVFEHADHSIVRCFLKNARYVDFSLRDKSGRTVLHAACLSAQLPTMDQNQFSSSKSRVPVMEMVFGDQHPIDLRALDGDNRSILHHLLDNVDMDDSAILEILKHPLCKEMINWKDTRGYTAVQYGLRKLRPRLVEALLKLGADLQAPDPTGSTALHHIANNALRDTKLGSRTHIYLFEEEDTCYYTKSFELWQRFLAHGGDLECRDNGGNTPLLSYLTGHTARSRSGESCAEVVRHCHIDAYGKFFPSADVYARNNAGETALHVIARRQPDSFGRTEGPHDAALFRFMVKKGLDPLDEDNQGRTALDVAVACEQEEILELYRYKT